MSGARNKRRSAGPVTRRAFAWRPSLALGLIVVAALLPAFDISQQLRNPEIWQARQDPMTEFDRRLAPLRAALGEEMVVGYLPPAGSLDAAAAAAHFTMTRYALAPVLVENDLTRALIVADGTNPRHVPAQLEIARDLGEGLLLLRPRTP